jgi:DNA-binding MarR family transcriptional regulator
VDRKSLKPSEISGNSSKQEILKMAKETGLRTDFVDRLEQEWQKKRFAFSTLPLAICARVQRAAFYFETHIAGLAAVCGLNPREFRALSALWRSGPPFALNPIQLLEEYFIPAATLTRQVDRLVSLGLVERTSDPDDRRAVLIKLTPRGHKLVDDAMRQNTVNQPVIKALEELQTRDLETLNQLLRSVLLLFEERASLRSARPRSSRQRVVQGPSKVPGHRPRLVKSLKNRRRPVTLRPTQAAP